MVIDHILSIWDPSHKSNLPTYFVELLGKVEYDNYILGIMRVMQYIRKSGEGPENSDKIMIFTLKSYILCNKSHISFILQVSRAV